jgi:hypothetical protein
MAIHWKPNTEIWWFWLWWWVFKYEKGLSFKPFKSFDTVHMDCWYCNRSVKSQKVLKIGPSHLVYFYIGEGLGYRAFWIFGAYPWPTTSLGTGPKISKGPISQTFSYIQKSLPKILCTFHLCTVDILHTFNTLLPLYLSTNVEGTRVKLVGHGIRSHVFIENSPLPVCKICTFVWLLVFPSIGFVRIAVRLLYFGRERNFAWIGFVRIAVRSFYFERLRERERACACVCVCDSAENSSRRLNKAPLAWWVGGQFQFCCFSWVLCCFQVTQSALVLSSFIFFLSFFSSLCWCCNQQKVPLFRFGTFRSMIGNIGGKKKEWISCWWNLNAF